MLNREPKKIKKNFKSEVLSPIEKSETLMRLNHFLSSKYALFLIAIAYFVFMFLLFNLFINTFFSLPRFLRDSSYFAEYFKHYGIDKAFLFSYSGIFYAILALFVAALDGMLIYRIRVSWKNNNVGQKGTEYITEHSDLRKEYKAVPAMEKTYQGAGGFPVAWDGDSILIDTDPVNNLLIGITRSGKGEMIVFPMIDILSRSEDKPSMVVADLKIELYPACKKTLEERGYKVYLLNLVEPLISMGYNPLTPVIKAYKENDYDNAELLARSIGYSIFCKANKESGENEFWDNNSAFAVQALILSHVDDCLEADKKENEKRKQKILHEYYSKMNVAQRKKVQMIDAVHQLRNERKEDGEPYTLKEIAEMLDRTPATIKKYWDEPPTDYEAVLREANYRESTDNEKKITLYSIVHTFATLARQKINQNLTALDIYFNERPDLDRAKFAYTSIEAAGDRTKGSIISTALSKINIFVSGGIAKMTAESSIDLIDIGFGEQPIAVFLGIPPFESSNNFIASMFIKQTCFMLSKYAVMAPGQKCKRQVRFIFDEFGNLPPVEDIEKYITAGLGLNMYFTLVIQNFSQLKIAYGEKAQTIRGNCANTMYIMTNEYETAKEFSSMIGSETITNVSRIGQKMALDKSFTETHDDKPLINPNQLMHLKEGENIIVRPMKRKDLQGNDCESSPIFNRDKHRFRYRHKYLLDWFPSGLSVLDVHPEMRDHIVLDERIFNINEYFKEKQERLDNNCALERAENPIKVINWLTQQNKKYAGKNLMTMKIGIIKTIVLQSFISEEEKNELMSCLKVKKGGVS